MRTPMESSQATDHAEEQETQSEETETSNETSTESEEDNDDSTSESETDESENYSDDADDYPIVIKMAMEKYKVKSPDDLVKKLENQEKIITKQGQDLKALREKPVTPQNADVKVSKPSQESIDKDVAEFSKLVSMFDIPKDLQKIVWEEGQQNPNIAWDVIYQKELKKYEATTKKAEESYERKKKAGVGSRSTGVDMGREAKQGGRKVLQQPVGPKAWYSK